MLNLSKVPLAPIARGLWARFYAVISGPPLVRAAHAAYGRGVDRALASVPASMRKPLRRAMMRPAVQTEVMAFLDRSPRDANVALIRRELARRSPGVLTFSVGQLVQDVQEALRHELGVELESQVFATGVEVANMRRTLADVHRQVVLLGERLPSTGENGPAAGSELVRSRIHLAGLNPPVVPQFLGRDEELRILDNAWAAGKNIISVVAWGGMGKSALVSRWLAEMAASGWRGAEVVFGWSFGDTGPSGDQFIHEALVWFGDPKPGLGSSRAKALRLVEFIRHTRTLLVLDGVEALQHPPNVPEHGRFVDEALTVLVRELAMDHPGLCVVTSREPVADTLPLRDSTCPQIDLGYLSPETGADLLALLGVDGPRDELVSAAEEVRGHALTLAVLGNYLRKARGGNVAGRRNIRLLEVDAQHGAPLARILIAYEAWLGESAELSLLRMMAFFERAVSGEELRPLYNPPIEGVSGSVASRPDVWNWAASTLQDCGLVMTTYPLEAHPSVREYFAAALRDRVPAEWRQGHGRLFYAIRDEVGVPTSPHDIFRLYEAVEHGCEAGWFAEAFDLYWRVLQRGDEFHSLHALGTFSRDLAVLSRFFASGWDTPTQELPVDYRAWLLGIVGFNLRTLGRLQQAVAPMSASIVECVALSDWRNAAVGSGNLCELLITIGQLDAAEEEGLRSVKLADRSGERNEQRDNRSILAEVYHHQGQWTRAASLFRCAERIQQQTGRTPLTGLAGYRWSTLRLDVLQYCLHESRRPSSAVAVRLVRLKRRSEKCLAIVADSGNRLNQSLEHLVLGRVGLLRAQLGSRDALESAETHVMEALRLLRDSHYTDELPKGLLLAAAVWRERGAADRARAALQELTQLAEYAGMTIYQVDSRIEHARISLGEGNTEAARSHLARARATADAAHYRRREWELAAVAQLLSGSEPEACWDRS